MRRSTECDNIWASFQRVGRHTHTHTYTYTHATWQVLTWALIESFPLVAKLCSLARGRPRWCWLIGRLPFVVGGNRDGDDDNVGKKRRKERSNMRDESSPAGRQQQSNWLRTTGQSYFKFELSLEERGRRDCCRVLQRKRRRRRRRRRTRDWSIIVITICLRCSGSRIATHFCLSGRRRGYRSIIWSSLCSFLVSFGWPKCVQPSQSLQATKQQKLIFQAQFTSSWSGLSLTIRSQWRPQQQQSSCAACAIAPNAE